MMANSPFAYHGDRKSLFYLRNLVLLLILFLLPFSGALAQNTKLPNASPASGELRTEIVGELGWACEFGEEPESYFTLQTDSAKRRIFGKNLSSDLIGKRVVVTNSVVTDSTVMSTDGSTISLSLNHEDRYGHNEAQPAGPLETQNVLFIFLNFQDNPLDAVGESDRQQMVFGESLSVTDFYLENSFGLFGFNAEIAGYYTIPFDGANNCDFPSWAQAGEEMAEADGFALSNYPKRVFIWPSVNPSTNEQTSCGWAGAVYPPFVSRAYINMPPLSLSSIESYVNVMSHELGHTFSLLHANYYDCGEVTLDVPSNCDSIEYGDLFSMMGGLLSPFQDEHPRQFNGAHKRRLEYLSGEQGLTVTESGVYTLEPSEFPQSTLAGLTILRDWKHFYITYRVPFGNYDLDLGLNEGAFIYYQPSISGAETRLLHMSPGTDHWSLTDGQSFDDPEAGIHITQLQHTDSSVTLDVNFEPWYCAALTPELAVTPLSYTVNAGESVIYELLLTNHQSSGCPPRSYDFSWLEPYQWGELGGGSGEFSPSFIEELAPGESALVTFTVSSPPDALPMEYPLYLYAFSQDGGGSKSAQVSYEVIAALIGDVNGNGVVDFADLMLLLSHWGESSTYDLSGDGIIGFEDLAIVLANWSDQ